MVRVYIVRNKMQYNIERMKKLESLIKDTEENLEREEVKFNIEKRSSLESCLSQYCLELQERKQFYLSFATDSTAYRENHDIQDNRQY
jgi:hypothetical protein